MNSLNSINKEKLPIKYYLNIYPSLDGYPTNDNILYELLNTESVIKTPILDYKIIKYIVSFKLTKERFQEFIDYYLGLGYLENTSQKETYILNKNPWS